MRAFPATRDWHIHFVHRRDAEQPNSRRPARVLLRDGDAPELVAPVSGGTSRLFGFVYEAQDLAVEDHEWIACSPAVRWQPGRLPVVVRSHPLELELVDELEAERRRRREAASAVSRALSGGSTGSTLERVGLLEHADALLGGHVVPLAALEALRFELSSPPEIGDAADLNRRLRDAARIGNAALTRALSQVGFEEVGRNLDIRARLTTAVDRAFGAHSALDPRLWQTMRQRLLWSWWTHARVWSEGLDLNGLARKLGSDRRTLESLARAEIAPGPELRNHLPSEEDALQQLELPESLSSPQVAQIAASFRPRLELMSSQIAELERLVGRVDTLTTWESAAAALESIANDLEINRAQGLQVWELGRIAAEQFREGGTLVLAIRCHSRGCLALRDCTSSPAPLLYPSCSASGPLAQGARPPSPSGPKCSRVTWALLALRSLINSAISSSPMQPAEQSPAAASTQRSPRVASGNHSPMRLPFICSRRAAPFGH